MGGICSSNKNYNNKNNKVLVLQTGKLRAKNINLGQNMSRDMSKNIHKGVVHRWLKTEYESKYEALDFVNKFKIEKCDYINIFDDTGYLLRLCKPNEKNTINKLASSKYTIYPDLDSEKQQQPLIENVNIIVACGSSSLQAFKLTIGGPKILLPISDSVRNDITIIGDKNDPNLSPEVLACFGGSNDNTNICDSVLNFLNNNAYRKDDAGNNINTNIIIVNQLGYSVLGFNPRDGSPAPVPTTQQKIVSVLNYDKFKTNKGKTGLIEHVKSFSNLHPNRDNMFVVARQCKVKDLCGKEQELSGQWATQIYSILKNETSLGLAKETNKFKHILDLGGSSGTFYTFDKISNSFIKNTNVKDFMKDKPPNSFENSLSGFINEFNEKYTEIVSSL